MKYRDLPYPFPFTAVLLKPTRRPNARVIVEEIFGRQFRIRTTGPLVLVGKGEPVRLPAGAIDRAPREQIDLDSAVPIRADAP